MKIIKRLRFSRMFIPVVIIALLLGTVSVGAGVATVLNLTSTSEETVEPIVYTFDNADTVKNAGSYGNSPSSYADGWMKIETHPESSMAGHHFAMTPAWPGLGEAFNVEDRPYLKIDYKLSGLPEGQEQFELDLYIYHGADSTQSRTTITVDCETNQFENGDELAIVVDMAKRNTTDDAVWIKNITDDTEYVVAPITSHTDTTYTGEIVKADLRLAMVANCKRTAYVKYLGFFATSDEALEYPLAEEIAKLQANAATTIDGTHVTKGHAIEAAKEYMDSFGFTTNPEVKVGDFTAPTENTTGSYVFDVVFGNNAENQTTVTVTMTIEKAIEPIVYTFDNTNMVAKIDGYGNMKYSFDTSTSTLQMQALASSGYSFCMKSTYPKLGDAFEVGSRRYLKLNYTLSGVPNGTSEFQVDLYVKHDNPEKTSEAWFNLNCTALSFENGDELEIIVDMAKRGTLAGSNYGILSDAVWVRNVTKNTDYIQTNSYFMNTEYTGNITFIEFRLSSVGGTDRVANVKYVGFFNNLDVAKMYPEKAPVSPIVEAYILDGAEHPTWDGSIITKGHAIEAAQEYIDSFNFTTNPVVKEGTFTAPTTTSEGSYVFDVVFGSGTAKEITVTVTMTIKKIMEPIVYTFDNADMVSKVATYWYSPFSFKDGYLSMKTNSDVEATSLNAHHFSLQPTWPKLGEAFNVEDRPYLKIDYKLSGLPAGQEQFDLDLYIYHGADNTQSRSTITVDCENHQFENGDELAIVVDMAKRNTTDEAVWIKNITKNTEYVAAAITSHTDTTYTGSIVKADLRLAMVAGCHRSAEVKYLGFFATSDEALHYPSKKPVSALVESYMLDAEKDITRDSTINTKELAIAEAKSYIDSFGFTTNPEIQEGTFTAPGTEADGSYVFDVVFGSGTDKERTVTVTMTIKKVIEPIVYTLDNADIISKLGAHYYTVLTLENGYAKMQTRTGEGYDNSYGFALQPNWSKLENAFNVEDRPYFKFDYKLSGIPEEQAQFIITPRITHGGVTSDVTITVDSTAHQFKDGDELEIIIDLSKRNTTEDGVWIKNVTRNTEYIASPLTSHASVAYEGLIESADFRLAMVSGCSRTAYVQYFGFFNTLTAAKNYSGATVAQQRLEAMEQELADLLDTLSIEWGDGNTEEKALNRATALIGEAGIGANLTIQGYTASTKDSEGSVRFSTTLVSGGQTANVDGLAIKINKVPESIVWRFNSEELKDKLGLTNTTAASIQNNLLKLERKANSTTGDLGFVVETPADAEQFYLQSYPYIVMKYKRHGAGPFQILYSTDKWQDARFINTYLGIGPEEDQWYTSIIDTTVKDREAPLVWNFNHDDPSKNWNYRLPTMVAILPTDRYQGLTQELNFSFGTFRQADATVELEYIAFFPTMEAALEYKNENEIEGLKLNAEAALKNYTGTSIFYNDGDSIDTVKAKAKEIIESKLGTELMKKVQVSIENGQYNETSYTFTASVTTQDGQTEVYVKSNVTLTLLDPTDMPAELDAVTDILDATCYHSDALTEEGAEHTAKKLLASKVAEGVEVVDANCVSLTPSTQDDTGNFTCEVTLGCGEPTATYHKTVRVEATVSKMPKTPIIINADDRGKLASGSLNISTKDGNIHTESLDTPRSDEYFWLDYAEKDSFYLPDYPYFNMKLKRTVESSDNMGRSQIYFWNTENTGSPCIDIELGGIDTNGKWVSTVVNMRDGSATLYDMETSSVYSTNAATGSLVGSGYDGLLTKLRITTSRDITAKRVTDIEYIGFFPTMELVEDYMKGILVDGYHSFNGEEYAVAKNALDAAPRTIEAVVRVKSEQSGIAMNIISNKKSEEDNDYFSLEMTENGNVKFVYGDNEVITDATVPTDEWVHVAAVVEDTEVKIYITPTNSQPTTKTASISTSTSEGLLVAPVVGGDYTATNNFIGDIANVELYDVAKEEIIFKDHKLPAEPKAEEVIACWPMSKLSVENTYADIHGKNTLTLKDAKGIAGHEFTGSDYVKTEKELAAEPKAFESHIKIFKSQLEGTYTLLSNETNDSTDHFSIQLVNGEIQVEYNSGDDKVLTTSGLNLTPGKWTHVAVTLDGTPALYIDGNLFDKVQTETVQTGVSRDKLYIGASLEDTKETFVGHMSDVKVWSKALAEAVDGDLLSAWKLDEQTYLEYTDASSYGNTGTLYSNGWYKLENLTYDYTIMHVADTQNLIGYNREDQYLEMMGWIANNKEKMNTQFVFHLGDVTQRNVMMEWAIAKEGFDLLDAVKLPYTMVLGNHDYLTPTHGIGAEFRDESNFNATFPYEEYLENDTDVVDKGAFKEGDSTNVYKCFDVETENGTIEYMVFALEFGPRDEVLNWVSSVLEENPNRKAFITTHGYQDQTGRLATFDVQRYGGDFKDANEGVDMWNKLVSKHDNIVMVNCGHAQGTSTKHLLKNNDSGKGVVQILADPSAMLDGGDFNTTTSYGIFMIMAFTDEGQMHTYYYSPIKNMYWDTANEYTYDMFTENGAVCVQEKGKMIEDTDSQDTLVNGKETFTYLVSNDAGNDKAIINLPENYSADGEPVKLVIYNRGAGTSLEESPNSSLNNELLKAGYATLHVRGIPEAYQNSKYIWSDYGVPYGSPVFIDSVIAAYEYITEKYNIDINGCAVFGASAGGLQSLNLVNHAAQRLSIKAVLLDAPVVDLYNDCYFNGDWRTGTLNGYTAAGVAWMYQFEHCDFENGTYTVGENTYSFSSRDAESLEELWELNITKVKDYNPCEYGKYTNDDGNSAISLSVPIQMWFGSRETVNNVDFGRQFIENCINAGVSAEFVSVDTDKHVIYANHPEYCSSMVEWIKGQ